METRMNWSGILLAGGQSSRMGSNKSLLPWQGMSLLQSTHNKLKAALIPHSPILVSGQYSGFSCVQDQQPERGPIEGIWSCTRQIGLNSRVLVVPVDMPLLSVDLLKILIDSFQMENEPEFIQFENFEMPFVFWFNERTDGILCALRTLENSAQRSLRHFKSQLRGKTISPGNREHFKNVNTPQDYQEVRK